MLISVTFYKNSKELRSYLKSYKLFETTKFECESANYTHPEK